MSLPIYKREIPKGYFLNNPERIIPDEQTFFNTLGFELTLNKGCLRFVDGATYPSKGVPQPEVIYALNFVKETVKQAIKFPLLFLNKNKLLTSFNQVCDRALLPYMVNPDYFCPTAKGVSHMITMFLIEIGIDPNISKKTGYNIAHLFEYDDAYRYRMQDIATETDVKAFKENPRKELARLMKIWRERDRIGVTVKMEMFMKPVLWLLLIPKYKKAVSKMSVYIKAMVYDEADWYWTCMKDDYHFGGKIFDERIKDIVVPQVWVIQDNQAIKK